MGEVGGVLDHSRNQGTERPMYWKNDLMLKSPRIRIGKELLEFYQ